MSDYGHDLRFGTFVRPSVTTSPTALARHYEPDGLLRAASLAPDDPAGDDSTGGGTTTAA